MARGLRPAAGAPPGKEQTGSRRTAAMAADNFGQARNTKKSKSSEQTQLPKPRSRERSLERAWPSPVGPLMPSTLVGDDGFHFSARARALDRRRALRKLHQCAPTGFSPKKG